MAAERNPRVCKGGVKALLPPPAQADVCEEEQQTAAKQEGVYQARRASVQPSRHTVHFGGWAVLGPSLWHSEAAPSSTKSLGLQERRNGGEGGLSGLLKGMRSSKFGTREVPLALWGLGSCITALFYKYVALGCIPKTLTVLLYAAVCMLAVRITCRDPGILPRAWQITQCPRLHDEVDRFLRGRGPETSVESPVCYTCCIMKPIGVSHCSVCDACVVGFDHHCGYLGACIGVRNHGDFMWLLYAGLMAWLLAGQQAFAIVCGPAPRNLLLLRTSAALAGG